jgi:hypothetical protein
VPERYGPRDRAYDLFRRCQRDDTWKGILEQLQVEAEAKGLISWNVSVDSAVCRAHQHAAGARKKEICSAEPPGRIDTEPDALGLGRSRGGMTTKIHLAVKQGHERL